MSALMAIEINLFGAIEIRRQGELLTVFRSQKELVLLAYLIWAERPVTREYLAGLAWPETDQTQALGLLRRSLYDLNQHLPGCLVIDRRTVHFHPLAPVPVDAHTFAHLIAQPKIEAWVEAVALYRAPFLQGIYVEDAPELESWLHREQELWQQAVVEVLYRLIGHYLAQGEYAQALHYTQQVLALAPWQERAHRQAMLLLARTGALHAALAQYELCRQTLWEELGVEPAPETTACYARIQTLLRLPSPKLPRATTPFIGREEDLVQLTHLVASQHCHLITIGGVGGIGKTRLALEVARSVATAQIRMFLHGVIFVPLAGVETVAQLIAAMAQALSLTLQVQEHPETQLLMYLRDKELLLVLDNFEQLIDERSLALLVQLLHQAAEVKCLITSRTRLNLQGEHLYWMQGLQYPITLAMTPALSPETLIQYSGIRLFVETAQRIRSTYTLVAQDVPALIAICHLVQGLPLALELAAAWVSVLSPTEIAAELAQNLDFLASEAHDLPLRQRSMRAVFVTSWRLLTKTEQEVFQKLSVFRGGFTREAAQALAGASLAVLMGLVHKSFLHKLPNDRFEVHELLRQFAQEYLARRGESHAIQRRHAEYFRALAELAESLLYSTEQRRWVERLESDHDNLQAALTWALAHQELECLVRLASALSHFWDCRGYYVELNQWLEQAITLAEHAWGHLADRSTGELEPALRRRLELLAKVLVRRAEALMHDRQQAEALYRRSLAVDQQIGPTLTTVKSYNALAWIERRRGNFLRADELQRAALQLAQTLPGLQDQERQRTIALALVNQGVNAFFQADLQRCETLVQQALPLADKEKDRRNLIHANGLLGLIAMYGGDFARASTLLTNCYAEFTAAGDTDGVIYVRCHLGLLALRRDDWRTAQLAFVENLSWLQRHHRDYDAWVHNLRGLVEVLRRQQRYVLAAQLLGALEMIRERIKYVIAPVFQPDFSATIDGTRSQLDPATFSAAYCEGYSMSPEQALAFALANL